MPTASDETDVLDRLARWAESQPLVRALVLESSRATGIGTSALDAFSDYDVLLVVADLDAFEREDGWIRAFGRPLVRFNDTAEVQGVRTLARLVLYEDGTKIDYMVWPDALVRQVVERQELPELLDWGYRVLLDKDSLAAKLPAPTGSAHIPKRPSEAEYRALVEEFWWETTYVAKNLWRDDLMFARYNLDVVLKHELLVRMLEWRVEIERGWQWKPGPVGRGLKRALPAELWSMVEATFAGPGIEENWEALFALAALFRHVAQEMGAALGYDYPQDMDQGVTAYLERARALPH
jgi:aminoglycoside 6-adenylyltransferase